MHLPQPSPIVARKLFFPLVDRQLLLDITLLLDYSDISAHLLVAVQELYYDCIFSHIYDNRLRTLKTSFAKYKFDQHSEKRENSRFHDLYKKTLFKKNSATTWARADGLIWI